MSRLYDVSNVCWLKTKRNFRLSDELPELPKPAKPNWDDNMEDWLLPYKNKQCECGADIAGSGKHSDYCPKYEKEQQ